MRLCAYVKHMPTGMCQNDQKHKQNEHSAQGISSFFREKKTMQKLAIKFCRESECNNGKIYIINSCFCFTDNKNCPLKTENRNIF
jgi:hypothetical protein